MVLFGVGIGKLCAKKENQAGIGDPQQYQNNGAGRNAAPPVTASDPRLSSSFWGALGSVDFDHFGPRRVRKL